MSELADLERTCPDLPCGRILDHWWKKTKAEGMSKSRAASIARAKVAAAARAIARSKPTRSPSRYKTGHPTRADAGLKDFS